MTPTGPTADTPASDDGPDLTAEQLVVSAAMDVLLSLSRPNLAATRRFDFDKPTVGRGASWACQIPRYLLRDLATALDTAYPGLLDEAARRTYSPES